MIDLTEFKKVSKQLYDINKQLSTNIKRIEQVQSALDNPKGALVAEAMKRVKGIKR